MTVLLCTLGVAALLLIGILSAITLKAVLRLRFVPPRTELLQALDVPGDIRARLAPGLAQLDALGFVHPAALRQTQLLVAGQPLPQHGLVLLHAEVPAAGYVVQLAAPDRGRPWSVFFVSRTQAGHTLVTRNRASAAGTLPLPEVTTQDCWAPDWATLWQAHRQRMKTLQPDAALWRRLSAPAWVEAGGQFEAAAFVARVERGDLVDAGAGSWRFGLRCALATLVRAWRTFFVASRAMKDDTPAAAGDVAHSVDSFERGSAAQQAGRWSKRAKWLLFFATAAAAAASFGLSMDLGAVPALVLVLLFHELGHYAAMRRAGYRDLQVFFLPFLGAAVSGRHEHPSAAQELVVLFAGPVPGLLLGLAALWGLPADVAYSGWWHSCALLAITINAFNLLPIHPLDGGKIFEILLLGRWPWLAFGGRVLGIVAFAGLALTMHGDIGRGVLWGLVLLMLLGLNHQRQEARLAAALRAQGAFGGQARGEALHTLFGAMQRLGLGAQPWASQRALAEALLPAMTRPRLSRGARAGGLLVYGFFLCLPVLVLMGGIWFAPRGAEVAAAAPPPADSGRAALQADARFGPLLARVNAEADPVRRWALLVDQFGDQAETIASMGPGPLPAAEALLRQAETLAAVQPDARSAQAQAALWSAQARADGAERRQRLLAVMARYEETATAPADREPLLRASLDWLYEARDAEPAQRARVIDRALAAATAPPVSGLLSQPLRELKVEQLLGQGDGAAAGRLVQAWFDSALAEPQSSPGSLQQAALLRIDVVLALQGPAAALREVDLVLPQLDALPPQRRIDPSALRRHGMLLAELAGRADWQRAQVTRLSAPDRIEAGLPWWGRALLWASRRGADTPPNWLQLEQLHWQGDSEGAVRVAAALKQRRAGAVAPGTANTEGLAPLAAARLRLHSEARRALAQRYGLPS